jgi:hypothetical protein
MTDEATGLTAATVPPDAVAAVIQALTDKVGELSFEVDKWQNRCEAYERALVYIGGQESGIWGQEARKALAEFAK